MSVIPVLGREVVVPALGRRWQVHRMDIEVLDRFIDWIRPQLKDMPDPLARLEPILPRLSREEAVKQIEEAKRYYILDYGSPIVDEAMNTRRGQVRLFMIQLQFAHPDVTLGEVFDIMQELGPDRMADVFQQTQGQRGNVAPPAGAGNVAAPSSPPTGTTSATA